METFTAITFEAYVAGEWVDITADVRTDPPPSGSRGIMGNSLLDRVAGPGYLRFNLDNSIQNSAGLAGYYTPGHDDALTGWGVNIPVRLSFTWDSRTYYKWYGRIMPNGIQPTPGIYGKRDVIVNCHDFMGQAATHILSGLEFAQDKTIDEVVPLIVAAMPVAPLATDYETGVSTFPSVFDTIKRATTTTAEFQKLALSELGYIYVIGDTTGGETLRVENQDTRTDTTEVLRTIVPFSDGGYLLLETGDYLLLESEDKIILDLVYSAAITNIMDGMQVSHGAHYTNRVLGVSYPRAVDASATTTLASLQKSFRLKAGEVRTGYRMTYRDPDGAATRINGIEMVTTPTFAANSDEDGGGTDYTDYLEVTATFGTDSVVYDLTNNSQYDLWVTQLDAIGKGVYTYDPVETIHEDTTEQTTAGGVYETRIDMRYQDDPVIVDDFSQLVLGIEKTANTTVDGAPIWANEDTESMGLWLQGEPGSRVTVTEAQAAISGDYFINGYSFQIINGKFVIWSPVFIAASHTDFGRWDTAAYTWDNARWGLPEQE